jgi:hypothetical protein
MFRLTLIALAAAVAIAFAGGIVLADEGCGHDAKTTTTKTDSPKPLTASTR